MTVDELEQIQLINQQLDHMKDLGLIEGYSVELGNSLETSNIKLRVPEAMIPLVFKTNDKRTIN